MPFVKIDEGKTGIGVADSDHGSVAQAGEVRGARGN